jgi:hypothetical protein
MKFGYAITRNAIDLRPDAIVRASDPSAVYVEVIPRERWTEIIPDRASDGGFIRVDEPHGVVLFEGIKQRYCIPGSAIQLCESVSTQPQAGNLGLFATVIQAPLPADASNPNTTMMNWEAAFMIRPITFRRFNGTFRRRSSEALRDQIRRVIPNKIQRRSFDSGNKHVDI